MCWSKITWSQPSVPVKPKEGTEVENRWNIEWSIDPVNASLTFVEEWSVFPEIYLTSFIFDMKLVISEYSSCKLIINKGAHENARNFDNNLESNKVNDAVIHQMLVKQHIDIQQLSQDIDKVSY